ncbi:hypothetical protein EW146_g9556 [Bondarzewia mesenterica]|uniref:Alcohol dehydrogenase-like N-terminal domain-containing protein n=1 Tax=Bondarzewia mesenterica TaxID=1095465 RepID=A0A4S4L590_9AGAM|nr:hypothetical protein EW146_g9556 [Bondarzewia mesenterica]
MQTAANKFQERVRAYPTEVTTEYKARKDGSTMKALAWFGPDDVRIVDAPIPDIVDPDDVILKVTGTTICGSDLHLYHGEIMALQKGDILGHEKLHVKFMGIIDQVGSNVKDLRIGQRVVSSFQIGCGKCRYCKEKLSSFCDRTNPSSLQNYMYGTQDAGLFGYSHFTGGFPGGQAEYVRVPVAEYNLLPIPEGLTDEQVLFLSDVLPTSYHNVVDTEVKEGDVVGIWGLGPIGQCAARWAKLKSASRRPSTLKSSRMSHIHELVPGGLDVALDCGTFHEPKTLLHKAQKLLMLETDVPETANEMILSVRKRGRCGLVAVHIGFANGFNIGALMEKGIRFIGNGQAPTKKYWHEILNDYIIPGKFDPTFVIPHRVPLEDMAKLYAAFDKRQDKVLKVFVEETKFSSPPSPGCPKMTRVDDWKN